MTKRFFIFVASMLLSVAGAWAQDIITLRNGDDIEALVQEIGTDEVKYKKFENPNGPNYTLKKSEIFMIRYVNGSKDVFKDEAPVPINVQSMSGNQQDPPIDYATFTQLRRDDNRMEEFLRTNDNALYEQFHKGASLRRSGGSLLGVGLGLSVIGVIMMIAGSNNTDYHGDLTDDGALLVVVGSAGIVVGEALIITSIPLSAVGGSLKRRAADSYEEKYFGNQTTFQPSLNFGITGNGVGLALKF
ncbi:MAG: hypothetical protein FWG84_08375 [Bacteroidales bacterium]|nr:hypothetical protein [Bacteroidales bacterium]